MKTKALFEEFSRQQPNLLPFCMSYDWWNEVIQEHWDVAVVANGKQVLAIWPYFIRKKGPWKLISNAYFTPYGGPIYLYPEGQKNDSKISFEHKMNQELIAQLPEFAELNQHFHLNFKNALAFIWKGFEVQQRYTYLLDLNQIKETIWSGFRENCRREIRKADKSLSISENNDFSLLENLLSESFQSQGEKNSGVPKEYFERIMAYVLKHKCGKSWKAVDANNEIYASILCIWDHQTAYYLIGGASTKHKNSGAMSLLLWHAIQFSMEIGKVKFNFEGSTIPAIERYLRGFGGELQSYSRISKKASTSFSLAKKLKG